MAAILFGSIGTLADTSELQRRSFNDAFARHGLDWSWDRDAYRDMLEVSGGADRIATYAAQQGIEVDAAAVHAAKTERFHELLATEPVAARPGVVECIQAAGEHDVAIAVVTTTSPSNVTAVLAATGLDTETLAVVLDAGQIERPKPDPEAYLVALSRLGTSAGDCLAIEDNLGGVEAAVAAGVRCLAFPNENTVGHAFPGAEATIDRVDLEELLARLASS